MRRSTFRQQQKELLMLEQLTNPQLELALQWLENPQLPQENLPKLTSVEWFLLRQLLDQLTLEKQQSPLH